MSRQHLFDPTAADTPRRDDALQWRPCLTVEVDLKDGGWGSFIKTDVGSQLVFCTSNRLNVVDRLS